MSKKRKNENYKDMIGRWFDHAQLRAMERYALRFSHEIQSVIREDIKKKVFNIMLEIPNSDRIVVRGRVCDEVVTMIYSTKHDVVVTFLHNNWVSTDTDEFYIMYKSRRKPKNPSHGGRQQVPKGGKIKVNEHQRRKLKAPRAKELVEQHIHKNWEDELHDSKN